MSVYTCLNCNNFKVYSTQASLTRHLKEVHGVFDLRIQSYPIDTFDYKCLEGCSTSYKNAKDLRQHLVQKHTILMDQAIFEFEEEDDFLNWMSNINSNPKQQYSITEEQDKNEHLQIKHYSCLYTETTDNGRTQIKNSKLQTLCTSEIIVIKNSRTKLIVVTCFKTHYGHPKTAEYIKSPVNYVTRRAIQLTSKMPERLINISDEIPMNVTKKQLKGDTKSTKRKQCQNKVTQDNVLTEQSNWEYYDNNTVSTLDKHNTNKKKCDKTSLKKDIICLLQELSGNDFEKYDINTLNNVKETLRECCSFLNSYEIPEEPQSTVDDSAIPQYPFPPSLLWFSEKDN
ncbi:uncharacterized protein LOC130893806 isoform X1 [Diorhabda carinulata]|uniref:uncharacterized protein LOC130893806 isoform X1 n=1 Tax=Diorhabda carinulata TaxID=1163345 RepID=UPI0025A183A1|nr:uncharacterized protein LOC130893806 isoform X1 [Diorhabda carinulata]